MSNELIFFTNPMSRGRVVRWALEEIGALYRDEIVDYGPSMKSDKYLAINPMGKVPALQHGGQTITETPAILAYLADAFPDTGLAPAPDQRGAYYRWLFYGAACWEPAVFGKAMGFEPNEEQQAMVGFGSYQLVLDTVEKELQGKQFLAGNTFSMADIYIASQIGFALQFKSIEARPAFEEYFTRISDREAYRKAAQIDDKLLEAAKKG